MRHRSVPGSFVDLAFVAQRASSGGHRHRREQRARLALPMGDDDGGDCAHPFDLARDSCHVQHPLKKNDVKT